LKKINKILLIENSDTNKSDIVACLPKPYTCEHKAIITEDVILEAKKIAYNLCISDILDIDTIAEGHSLESHEVFMSFERGIRRIAELRPHLDCSLVIVTKLPVDFFMQHIDNMKNDYALETIFAKDCKNLYRKLSNSVTLPFGMVYGHEGVFIDIKPYFANNVVDEEILNQWKDGFKKLLARICK